MHRHFMALVLGLCFASPAFAEKGKDCKVGVAVGDIDAQIAFWTDCIKTHPNDPITQAWSFDHRGLAYQENRAFDRAIADFSAAMALRPSDPAYVSHRGLAYAAQGIMDHAIADDSFAIGLDYKNYALFNNRGAHFLSWGDGDRAVADYDRSIALIASDWRPFQGRGMVFMAIGKFDAAVTDFGRGLALNPDGVQLLYYRAWAYYLRQDYDLAIADLNRAMSLVPSPDVRYARAQTFIMKGDCASAEADLAKLVAGANEGASLYGFMAWLLATFPNCRDGRKAVTLALKAVQLDDSPMNRNMLAAAYAEIGNFNDAKREVQQAIDRLNAAISKGDYSNVRLIADFQARLELYKEGKPFHQPAPGPQRTSWNAQLSTRVINGFEAQPIISPHL